MTSKERRNKIRDALGEDNSFVDALANAVLSRNELRALLDRCDQLEDMLEDAIEELEEEFDDHRCKHMREVLEDT